MDSKRWEASTKYKWIQSVQMTHRETRQWDSQFPGENLLLLQISANEKTKCENQLQSKWFRRKDTETFTSECSKMCCLRYISLYCLCIILALKATYSQSHRSVLYLTAATAAHRVERIPVCSFKIRSCFNAAHASWWMIFIFISLHSNKLYFLDTLSYY